MELTLEKELVARVFLHKVAIVRSALVNTYIAHELDKGGITLALPCIEKNALNYSDEVISKILAIGTLDEAYDKAWELIKEHMPDDFCIM